MKQHKLETLMKINRVRYLIVFSNSYINDCSFSTHTQQKIPQYLHKIKILYLCTNNFMKTEDMIDNEFKISKLTGYEWWWEQF